MLERLQNLEGIHQDVWDGAFRVSGGDLKMPAIFPGTEEVKGRDMIEVYKTRGTVRVDCSKLSVVEK